MWGGRKKGVGVYPVSLSPQQLVPGRRRAAASHYWRPDVFLRYGGRGLCRDEVHRHTDRYCMSQIRPVPVGKAVDVSCARGVRRRQIKTPICASVQPPQAAEQIRALTYAP
jgi:hypothetical protein